MALLAIVVMTSFVPSGGILKRDRKLTDLWISYNKASEKGLVQDMIDILEDVKEISLEHRFSEDYFRACDEYVNAGSRQNWRLTQSLVKSTTGELHAYGEPALEILFGLRHGEATESLAEKISLGAEAMKRMRNVGLYRSYGYSAFGLRDADGFNKLMLKSIDNDYEFIMWMLMSERGYDCGPVCGEFVEYLKDEYPAVPYIRYMKLEYEKWDVRKTELEKMADEYAGRGMGAAAEDELLWRRFNDMDGKAASEEYRRLEKEVMEFEAEKKALRGEEAAVAEIHSNSSIILDELRGKGAEVKIDNGEARIFVRNLDKVRFVVLKDKDSVFEEVVLNETGSFYRRDTLKVSLPVLDDGKYSAVVYDGREELRRYGYEKFTISLARRLAADGMCIYAADYLTGEPVGKADLLLYDNDMDEKVAEVKNFIFNGFTELPEEIYPFSDKNGCRLVCRYEKDGRIYSSKPMYMNNRELVPSRPESMLCARVVKDRAAFVPGDTVRFKTFLYEDRPDGTKVTVPEGRDVFVQIEDPAGNVVSEMMLKTNEFGSASGSYAVNGGGRNGRWAIWVRNGEYAVEPSYFTVDEFELPSYDLEFNDADRLYMPGDTVCVEGKVMSYSGHGPGGLSAVAFIYVNHKLEDELPVRIASDGTFEVSFVAGDVREDYVGYRVEMRLTDNTGETLEFNWSSDAVREINLRADLLNRDAGRLESSGLILSADTAEINCWVSSRGSVVPDIPLGYELVRGDKVMKTGRVNSGDTLAVDMAGMSSGLYKFVLRASVVAPDGGEVASSKELDILYVRRNEEVAPVGTGVMLRTFYEDGDITLQLGSGNGPVWAVVELFGKDYVPLEKRMLYVNGKAGESGSMETLIIPHSEDYSGKVFLGVFYFRDGRQNYYQETFVRPEKCSGMPLEFSSFVDSALPGQEISLKMKAAPDAEVLVSVFDASSQKIAFNSWDRMRFRDLEYPVSVSYSSVVGCDETDFYVIAYGSGRKKAPRAGSNVMVKGALAYDSVAEEEAVPFQLAEMKSAFMDAAVRDDFAATLAFEPFLRPDSDGNVELKFRTSDKLSTFIVKAMAHDKTMNTAFAEKEMLVTLPVRVSMVAPQYLYAGDEYVLSASVSNTSGVGLKGGVYMEVYDGDEYLDVKPVMVDSVEVDVPAGASAAADFAVPGVVASGVDTLGLKVVFVGYEYSSDPAVAVNETLISDGMFVTVPVSPAAQVLTEAHSAVVRGGESVDDVVSALRNEFVNVSSVGAEYEEVSLMELVGKAVPGAVEARSENAVSLSEAVYVNLIAAGLHDSEEAVAECVEAAVGAVSKLLACQNEDGGFGWFEGVSSTPLMTAVVLERYAGLRDRGLLDMVSSLKGEDAADDLDAAAVAAVKYLDSAFFGGQDRPVWYGRLQAGKYIHVRSMFAGITFDEDAARKAMGAKAYRKFVKGARGTYMGGRMPLVKITDYPGSVVGYARAAGVLNDLVSSDEGLRLAKAWGLSSEKKLRKALEIDLEVLKQYAVEDPEGGIYYPNAVPAWGGLLESEAYAHALICDVFTEVGRYVADGQVFVELADGIRVWLMLQKETQEWSDDSGFVDALASVCDGSGDVMDTKVVVLKKRYEKPFGEIKAAGNGFRVSVDYYKETAGGAVEGTAGTAAGVAASRVKLAEGDSLKVGEKVVAVYSLWSSENRSHVRLSVPRAACFRPADQLSGWSGGWVRPLLYRERSVVPYAYREVKANRTLWWIDVFPWEDTVIEEELFVTQEGTFTAPVAEIESLYAPHYRANDGFGGLKQVR